ncbi:hypothetical protein U9M48_005065 [Paspalum notatum var. saurae]|uniref:Uncharacterized protein n=1 Tax=Paspalum notatum var. saurae TaxID=547442 RepID=A0AAQ3PL19_PASNO
MRENQSQPPHPPNLPGCKVKPGGTPAPPRTTRIGFPAEQIEAALQGDERSSSAIPGFRVPCAWAAPPTGIRVQHNLKKSRKDFSCFKITKVVDSDIRNFKDFVEEIVDQYPHGYNEIVHPTNDDDNDDDNEDGYLWHPQPHNEHVGVDEEGLYLTTHKAVSESKSKSESESESDEDYEEEDRLIGKDPLPPIPIVSYDRDNPSMNVGSIYPNMREFRLALAQHALKHEFEFNTEKSDQGEEVSVKNATKFWICEQVKDWLMDDSRVGPKELQWRIKDKHKKFRTSYETLIPAMPDKNQWPESEHDFFMHPPLLKSTAGRRHHERFKGCMVAGGSTTRKKGSHQCPICKNYGYRRYKCKNGDPDDIAAMLAERGPPKIRKKNIEQSCESTIVAVDSTPKAMQFPSSQGALASLGSNSLRPGHSSNQPEALSIDYPMLTLGQTTSMLTEEKKKTKGKKKAQVKKKAEGKKKAYGKNKAEGKKKISVLPDSLAMSTRSKTPQRESLAAHSRSKRKLLEFDLNLGPAGAGGRR